MIGGAGADRMEGGLGDDSYDVDNISDVTVELAGEGVDTVTARVDFTLGANVENGVIAAGAAIHLRGNDAANVIRFINAPAYYLPDRNLSAGARATGLGGDDRYVYEVSTSYDLAYQGVYEYAILEAAAGGVDTFQTNLSGVRLASEVENLVVTPLLAGQVSYSSDPTAYKPKYYGNAKDNVIDLSQAVNPNLGLNVLRLVGGFYIDGGAGADTMIGSSINDTFLVDNAGDVVVESSTSAESRDRVVTSLSYGLGANVEDLELTGSAAVTGTGNALDNTLYGSGNSAANTLRGGAGNDTYVIGLNDIVEESAANGNDSVVIVAGLEANGRTFRISDYANVESLQVRYGTGPVNIVGDAGANTLTAPGQGVVDGGDGADTLFDLNFNDFNTLSVQLGTALLRLPNGGATLLGGSGDDTLTSVVGNSVLDGGTGNDLLIGLTPVDADSRSDPNGWTTYVFGTGYGADRIQDDSGIRRESDSVFGTRLDKLRITDATDARLLRFFRSGNDLVVSIFGSQDSATISGFWNSDGTVRSTVDTIELGGGGILTRESMLAGLTGDSRVTATADADLLIAANTSSTISGGGGNDHITGSGHADTLRGDAGNDYLSGGLGNDLLEGGAGDDFMVGGDGDDIFVVDAAGDVAKETFYQKSKSGPTEVEYSGNDTVRSSVSYEIGAGIENLELLGVGAIDATGNYLANRLRGNSGANRLDGLWGADDMAGGAGDDTYVVDNSGDIVTELANEGIDTVEAGETYFINSNFYALGANVENLVLTGTNGVNGLGNALNNHLVGNSGDNRLEGLGGFDLLEGGQGGDTLISQGQGSRFVFNRGDGQDYIVNQAAAVTALGTLELGAGIAASDLEYTRGGNEPGVGADDLVVRIKNSQDYAVVKSHFTEQAGVRTAGLSELKLADGTRLTRAELDTRAVPTGLGGGGSPGTPPSVVHQVIYGTAGDDYIDLRVSYMNDAIYGQQGDDIIYADGGDDTVDGGDGNDWLYGNDGRDWITGGAGNDYLSGGSGFNTMYGGEGDDYYFVDNLTDYILEFPNAGNDYVRATVSWALDSDFEGLLLAGSSPLIGQGNAQDNYIYGNAGDNILSGGGGSDTIRGGAGNDTIDGGTRSASIPDLLDGGTGDDVLISNGSGANFSFIRGDGNDVIVNRATSGTASGIIFSTTRGSIPSTSP